MHCSPRLFTRGWGGRGFQGSAHNVGFINISKNIFGGRVFSIHRKFRVEVSWERYSVGTRRVFQLLQRLWCLECLSGISSSSFSPVSLRGLQLPQLPPHLPHTFWCSWNTFRTNILLKTQINYKNILKLKKTWWIKIKLKFSPQIPYVLIRNCGLCIKRKNQKIEFKITKNNLI